MLEELQREFNSSAGKEKNRRDVTAGKGVVKFVSNGLLVQILLKIRKPVYRCVPYAAAKAEIDQRQGSIVYRSLQFCSFLSDFFEDMHLKMSD